MFFGFTVLFAMVMVVVETAPARGVVGVLPPELLSLPPHASVPAAQRKAVATQTESRVRMMSGCPSRI